jgi:hypothetical protein
MTCDTRESAGDDVRLTRIELDALIDEACARIARAVESLPVAF